MKDFKIDFKQIIYDTELDCHLTEPLQHLAIKAMKLAILADRQNRKTEN